MALEGGEGSASCHGRSLPPGKTLYPSYRRLGGPQGRSGQVRKILPPPGFDPQTVQPVFSHYTNYATWPTRGLTCSGIKTLPVPILPARCETRTDQGALQCSPLNVTHTSAPDRYLKDSNLDEYQGCFNHLLAIYLGRLDVQSW